jgi:hypothetical protein
MIYPPIPGPMTKQADVFSSLMGAKGKVLPWLARSVHAVTGKLPGIAKRTATEQTALLKRIGAGEHYGARSLQEAESELLKLKGTPAEARARRALNRAKGAVEWAKTTGGTLPGVARGLLRDPKKVISTSWRAMGPLQKGLLGYFGYTGARDIGQTPEWAYGQPGFPYRSRLHHLGSELGSDAAWLAGGPFGLVPDTIGYISGSMAGGLPGRLLARPALPVPQDAGV